MDPENTKYVSLGEQAGTSPRIARKYPKIIYSGACLLLGVVGLASLDPSQATKLSSFSAMKDPTSTSVIIAIVGDSDSADGNSAFVGPSPNLDAHRSLIGYDDDDIRKLYDDAADAFLDLVGIDFRGVPIDPVTGQQTSADGNWAVVTLQTNYGAKVVFSSVSGDNHENPTLFKTESLNLIPLKPDVKYYGKFGGEEGYVAVMGDFTSVGDVFVDLDNDGVIDDPIRFLPKYPFRNGPGGTLLTEYDLQSPPFGAGRAVITTEFLPNPGNTDADQYLLPVEGAGHVSFRALFTFPPYGPFF